MKLILLGNVKVALARNMKDKSTVLAIEYERWSIILMMLSLWKKNLKPLERFGDVLHRQTWEGLGEVLEETNKGKKGVLVMDELKRLLKSVTI